MKKYFPAFLLISLLVLLYAYLDFFSVLQKRPEATHLWAQCDRASVARNYSEESMNFFLPRVNETHENTGITGLEFPFMNYAAAVCYKLFGFSEFWYRLLMLLVFTAGCIAAFILTDRMLKNTLLSACITACWMLSPALLYYIPNFIPDTASLGFIMLAWYFFFQHMKSPGKKNTIAFAITSSLACLIKITSCVSLTVMLCLLILDQLKLLNREKTKLFTGKWKFYLSIIISFMLVAAWYRYASWLNNKYMTHVFLMKALPLQSLEQFRTVLWIIQDTWGTIYYHPSIYKAMIVCGILLLIPALKARRILLFTTLGLWIGNVCFFYLMFNQFRSHDYYIITLLPAVLFLFITAADSAINSLSYKRTSTVLILSFLLLSIHSAKYSKDHLEFRYNKDGWLYNGREFSSLYSIEPYLRSIGINRTDKVVSLYDWSPNITLYLMNVKGWRNVKDNTDDEIIQNIKSGASYLIVNDTTALSREKLQPYFKNKIGQYKSVMIYKL